MQSKLSQVSEDINENSFTEERLQELYPKLRQYCQFLSQNGWDGEDLVQESLIKAWKHYKHQPELSMALFNKIAHNVWIDTVRRRGKESLEEIPEHFYDESDHLVDRFETIQLLMKKLTPKQAVMVVLKDGFQYQVSEIAELLNTTETAVKATIHRAKQRLARKTTAESHPLIEQFWEQEDQENMEKLLHEAFITQDPSILIRSIPLIDSLRKETSPTCSLHTSRHSNYPSSTVYMAA